LPFPVAAFLFFLFCKTLGNKFALLIRQKQERMKRKELKLCGKELFSSVAFRSFVRHSLSLETRQSIFYKQSEIIKIPKGFVLRIQQWQNGKSLLV
jgi:hypothetical protein